MALLALAFCEMAWLQKTWRCVRRFNWKMGCVGVALDRLRPDVMMHGLAWRGMAWSSSALNSSVMDTVV